MWLLEIVLVHQTLVIIGCFAYTTMFPNTNEGFFFETTPPIPEKTCNGYFDFLGESPLVTFQYKPQPHQSNFSSVSWKKYGKSRPQFVMMICEFTSISSISFNTSNVKSSGIFINGESFYGAVDQFGKVEISTSYDSGDSSKFGWEVKVTVTPKNYSLPVEINNLFITTCRLFYDCFMECQAFILQSDTGCKMPVCQDQPCYALDCPEGQECRLIESEPLDSHLWNPAVQLWGCVDKDRTDYGCFCENYVRGGDYNCPTCQCGRNLTTTTTTVEP